MKQTRGSVNRPQRVHELTRRNVYAHSGDAAAQRTVELDCPHLRPGVYMVVCATFAAGQLGPFELVVYGNTKGLLLEQVYPPVWRAGAAEPPPDPALVVEDVEED